MDDTAYLNKLEDQAEDYEALCKRCGQCCGVSTGDPCINLEKLADGTYNCTTYDTRHALQRSVSGGMFTCVNIRDVIASGASFQNCPYCISDKRFAI